MSRGDIVTVSAPGAYGKPRPAIVVRSDWLTETESVLVALLTSALREAPIFRLTVRPSAGNDLKLPSQVMVDKSVALPRDKCGSVVGRLDTGSVVVLNQMLSVVLGPAD